MLILLITLLVVLIGILGFFSSSETALLSLSTSKVRTFKKDPDPRKQNIATLLANPQDLLTTLIILNIISNILVQNVVSSIFGEYSGWLVNVGVPLALTLIFGEIIPKSFALANNEKVATFVSPVITKAQNILYPARRALKSVASFVSRFLFPFLRHDKEISPDELKHVLTTSKLTGVLSEDEAEIASGFINLKEFLVKEVMRPREEILFFNIQEDLKELQHLIVDMECSRIPVCEGQLDNLLGVITSQMYFLNKEHIQKSQDLIPFLKKPSFVPESTSAEALLNRMYEKKESFAMVVDEYGSLSGLITLEDMVEIVIGEIADRRDESSRYTRSSPDSIIASGKLELAEFEEIFNIPLISQHNMVTVGGYLTEKMGEIPKPGSKYISKDFLFQVLSSDLKTVKRIYIRKLSDGGFSFDEEGSDE